MSLGLRWIVLLPLLSSANPLEQTTITPLDTYTCSVCQHVYDPAKDGGGLEFDKLPDSWKCPVCGSPKSAFKKSALAEQTISAPLDTYTCSVCQHVYDPAKDGGGLEFDKLPDSWKCPVCGSPKSAFKKSALAEQMISTPLDTYTCGVCQHVYDPAKDGGGLEFDKLPDSWKCPVCGSPKSAFKKSAFAEQTISAPLDTYTCSVCQHVYDPAKDGGGLEFDKLPDSWKCPVCGSPKSAFKKSAVIAVGGDVLV